ILIISEKNIHSVHCDSRLQVLVTCAGMVVLLWLSYSSGKYFAYESVLSNKNSEIYQVNQTNKNLLYQVQDLHQNLEKLHDYLKDVKEFDHLASIKELPQEDFSEVPMGEGGTDAMEGEHDEHEDEVSAMTDHPAEEHNAAPAAAKAAPEVKKEPPA